MNLHYNRANDLTQGSIMGTMLRFAVPMILGNLLQQCYNIADTLIVGHYLGADALAAVGSAIRLWYLSHRCLSVCAWAAALSFRYNTELKIMKV